MTPITIVISIITKATMILLSAYVRNNPKYFLNIIFFCFFQQSCMRCNVIHVFFMINVVFILFLIFCFHRFLGNRRYLVTWVSSLVVIWEILVHPSPEQCTLNPICSLLSLAPSHPFPWVPKIHCIILMPLHPRCLVPTDEWEHAMFGFPFPSYFM